MTTIPDLDARRDSHEVANTMEPAAITPPGATGDVQWAAAIALLWEQEGVGSRTISKIVAGWGDRDPLACLAERTEMGLFWRARFEELAGKIAGVRFAWRLVRRGGPGYPNALECLDHPPACLFLRGDAALLHRASFAVVGTRKPTEEGTRRARRLARALVERDFVVTSGLAAGVDTAALSAALERGGKAIAVIGTPLDKAYPRENHELQDRIAASGLIVSQYPFCVAVDRGNFPERNRTMAAIARATCVVEAGPTSGTRHQVECSRKIGHPAYFMRSMLDVQGGPAPWVLAALAGGDGLPVARVLDDPSQLDELC